MEAINDGDLEEAGWRLPIRIPRPPMDRHPWETGGRPRKPETWKNGARVVRKWRVGMLLWLGQGHWANPIMAICPHWSCWPTGNWLVITLNNAQQMHGYEGTFTFLSSSHFTTIASRPWQQKWSLLKPRTFYNVAECKTYLEQQLWQSRLYVCSQDQNQPTVFRPIFGL